LNIDSEFSPDIKIDLVGHGIPKLSYFDPSDAHDTNFKGKHANLVFQIDTTVMNNINDISQLSKNSFYRKALPAKIDNEKLSPYFSFRSHEVIQHTLRQTTQLSKSTIHYPMRHYLKSRFQILSHKKLNEVITTDTYFTNYNQLKDIILHKYFS
jgi:hypothetical protein